MRELTERARAGGLQLTGEDDLLGRLTKMVIEGALEGELDDHIGYEKHDPEAASRPAATVTVRVMTGWMPNGASCQTAILVDAVLAELRCFYQPA